MTEVRSLRDQDLFLRISEDKQRQFSITDCESASKSGMRVRKESRKSLHAVHGAAAVSPIKVAESILH